MTKRTWCLVAFFSFALVGCISATPLHPAAQQIMVSRHAAPEACEYLGIVIGQQGDALSGSLTSNKELAQGAVNDLRNRAQLLGATHVVLEDTRAGNTISGSAIVVHGAQTDVTLTGNAFRCAPKASAPTGG